MLFAFINQIQYVNIYLEINILIFDIIKNFKAPRFAIAIMYFSLLLRIFFAPFLDSSLYSYRSYNYHYSRKSDNYIGSNTDRKEAMNQCKINDTKSKKSKSDIYCYHKIGRAITIWGAIVKKMAPFIQHCFVFLGKYLGSHNEFNREVLKYFVECHEFGQLLLVQALRQFLWSFR